MKGLAQEGFLTALAFPSKQGFECDKCNPHDGERYPPPLYAHSLPGIASSIDNCIGGLHKCHY